MLASGGLDGNICVWDIGSGKLFKRFDGGSAVNCVSWSGDGAVVVGAASNNSVRFWDVEGVKEEEGGEGSGMLHEMWTKKTRVHEVRYGRGGLVFTVGCFNPA
jgi:WD40 repeat protein